MVTSTAANIVAHQAVSTGWDLELVPTVEGETALPDENCPVEAALSAISGKWTTLVLRNLMNGPLSYGELAESLPALSDKVLTERLGALAKQGLVKREVTASFPSRTRYLLTEKGRALRPLLVELYRTGMRLQTETTPHEKRRV